MNAPRATSLARILQDLGPSLLELLLGDPDLVETVESAAIYDADEPTVPARAVVLAVGVSSHGDLISVMQRAAADGAVAVVVRTPIAPDTAAQFEGIVRESGVALLGLPSGASWTELAYMLSTLIGVHQYLRRDQQSGMQTGDLFALANAVSALVDAPITIEDRHSQVLAFSGRQDEADQARIDTIISRRNPPYITRPYRAQGVFKALHSSRRPVFLAPVDGQSMPRVAVAVRAGNEVCGSIWAAVQGPLTPEREQAFVDCAKLVAIHLLRQTVGSDVARRFKAQRVLALLEGGMAAGEAARALGLMQPSVVWAWRLPSAHEAPSFQHAEVERQRVLDVMTFQLSALHPGAGITTLADVAYAVVPVLERLDDAEADSVRAAQALLRRTAQDFTGKIGVSRLARDFSRLPTARRDADRALRVLDHRGDAGRAAGITTLAMDALMLELRDVAADNDHQPSEMLRRLQQYDRDKHADLTATVAMWLAFFGDARAAAAAMQVHPNTFRYRMRRAVEVAQLDLGDASWRFALMVELRLQDTDTPRRA